MKLYDFNLGATHDWAIYRVGSEADPNVRDSRFGSGADDGGIVGSSEWIWLRERNARRITAALTYFEGKSTEEIEQLAEEKLQSIQ